MKGLLAVFLALFCALAAGKNIENFRRIPARIVGGTETTISNYPYATAMLYNGGWSSSYSQSCGGTIITSNAILSAAHCYTDSWNGASDNPNWWRIRVGSTQSSSGGQVHNIARVINHNQYNRYTYDYDVAVLRTATNIVYGASVGPASIAGTTYNLPDNSPVWAIGWGSTGSGGVVTNLRHVQVWTVNQNTCNNRYGGAITARMLCSGWLDVGGVDQCQGDSGGPLIHNGNIVGICSWGNGCAQAYYPGVNSRVSSFSTWIVQQAQS